MIMQVHMHLLASYDQLCYWWRAPKHVSLLHKDLSRESKRKSKLLDAIETLLKPINRVIRICDCSDRDDKPMVMRGCFLNTH
jgi:hypothetical protein